MVTIQTGEVGSTQAPHFPEILCGNRYLKNMQLLLKYFLWNVKQQHLQTS